MEIPTKLSVVLAVFLISASAFQETKAFEFGDLEKFAENVVDATCSSVVGGVSAGPCGLTYYETVKPLMKTSQASETQVDVQILSTMKYCCARSALRACLLESIKRACGEGAESKTDAALKKILRSAAERNDDSCTGDEIIYHKASPLCWSEPGTESILNSNQLHYVMNMIPWES